jgi:hypothetical protein
LYVVRDIVSTATIMSKEVNVYEADQDKTMEEVVMSFFKVLSSIHIKRLRKSIKN